MELSVEQLAGMIDHTLLKPFICNEDLERHCKMAIKYHFKTVAVNNAVLPFCRKIVAGTSVVCDAAVSFPLGQSTLETKLFETEDAIIKGAKEIDYVINLVEVKNANWRFIEKEMDKIVSICRKNRVVTKVIFENCYLTEQEKRMLCQIAADIRPDFIKTSTGFGSGGATFKDVMMMKKCVGNHVKVKAAGGIRDVQTALAMIEAGAERIGTSCGVEIIQNYKLSK